MSRWERIKPYAVPALVLAGVVLVTYWRLWFPFAQHREFGIDSQWEYWGDVQFQIDALRDGHFPLWNPYDRGGYPFFADPQAQILYPPNWLLVGTGLVTGPSFWLINLKNLFHFWLGATGMYAYTRRRDLSAAACYAAGALFILASPWIHHLDLALNWTMAYAPWLLLTVEAWAARPRLKEAAGLGLVFALAFLAGSPPTLWYTVCAATPIAVWAVVHHWKRENLRALLTTGAVAVGLCLAIVAAQAVATAGLLPNTVRASTDMEFALGTQFYWIDLLGFFVPRLTRLNQFVGIVAVFGVAAAVGLRWRERRTWVLVGIALFGILCSLGREGMILRWLWEICPPFRYFRFAFRYTYVTMVAVPILVAEGLTALAALSPERAKRWAVGFAAVGLAGAAALAFFLATKGGDRFTIGLPACLAATAVVVGLLLSRHKQAFLAAAAVVLLGENLIGHQEAIERNMAAVRDNVRDAEVTGFAGVPDEVRIYDRWYLKFRPGLRLHIRDFAGYEDDPLALERYAWVRDTLRSAVRRLGYGNIRWYTEDAHKVIAKSQADLDALREVKKGLYEVKTVAPAVMWMDRADFASDARGAISVMMKKPPGQVIALEKSMMTAEEIARASEGAADAPPVTGKLVSFEGNQMVATIDAPADGVVLIHETWYPGWTATVDGVDARILPANGMFRAVLVGPGAHTIEMRFHAPRFLILAVVELVALALALYLMRRREPA